MNYKEEFDAAEKKFVQLSEHFKQQLLSEIEDIWPEIMEECANGKGHWSDKLNMLGSAAINQGSVMGTLDELAHGSSEEARKQCEEISTKIQKSSAKTIQRSSDSEGVLTGMSVDALEIKKFLKKEFSIDRDFSVTLDKEITELGLYACEVRLHPDLKPIDVKIWIVPKN